MTTPSDTLSDLTRIVSALPPLPRQVVKTSDYRRGQFVCRIAIGTGAIGTISGPSGSGKTTTVVSFLRENDTRNVYVQLPQRARVRDVIAKLWEGMVGLPSGKRRQREMENDLVDLLTDGKTCIVADEIHNVGIVGMQALRYLHDRVVAHRNHGLGPDAEEVGGFPLLLVGMNVTLALAEADELQTRAGLGYEFSTVPQDKVAEVAGGMHPSLAASTPARLLLLDGRYCKGNLRRWRNVIRNLTELREKGDVTGISDEEVKDLLTLAGRR